MDRLILEDELSEITGLAGAEMYHDTGLLSVVLSYLLGRNLHHVWNCRIYRK